MYTLDNLTFGFPEDDVGFTTEFVCEIDGRFELLSLARVVYAAIVSALSRSCCGFVLPALTLVIEKVVIGTERGPGALEEEFVFVFGPAPDDELTVLVNFAGVVKPRVTLDEADLIFSVDAVEINDGNADLCNE